MICCMDEKKDCKKIIVCDDSLTMSVRFQIVSEIDSMRYTQFQS